MRDLTRRMLLWGKGRGVNRAGIGLATVTTVFAITGSGAALIAVGYPSGNPPVSLSPPLISGSPVVGEELKCSTGSWGGDQPQTYAFEWFVGGARVSSVDTYTITKFDVGREIECVVAAANSAGVVEARAKSLLVPVVNLAPSYGVQQALFAPVWLEAGVGNVSNKSALIEWGDGSATAGTLTTGSDPTRLDVTGSHTYWVPGQLEPRIVIKEPGAADRVFSGTAVVTSIYAALGDSYSAGEGSGWPPGQSHPNLPGCDYGLYEDPAGTPVMTDHIEGAKPEFISGFSSDACGTSSAPQPLKGNTCHRSVTAYPHVVEDLLRIAGMTLDTVACSGAVVNDAYTPVSGKPAAPREGENAQASTSTLNSRVSLITIGIGGNDLKFASTAQTCVESTVKHEGDLPCIAQDGLGLSILGYNTKPKQAGDGQFDPDNKSYERTQTEAIAGPIADDALARYATSSKPDLHDTLVQLYRVLHAQAPGARILVVGYPHFFVPGGSSGPCQYFDPFEQRWINERIGVADEMIRDAASESGVAEYVDTFELLTDQGNNHQECTGNGINGPEVEYKVDPSSHVVAPCTGNWINPIDALAGTFGSPENLHPNPCAHQAEGRAIKDQYESPVLPGWQFHVAEGQQQSIATTVTASQDRLVLSADWRFGTATITVRDPAGGTKYTPVVGTCVARGNPKDGMADCSPTDVVFDIPRPKKGAWAGTWTLSVANNDSQQLGELVGTVTVRPESLPALPPAGEIKQVGKPSCTTTTPPVCTETLRASVNKKRAGAVKQFEWFDSKGDPEGGATTRTLPDDTLETAGSPAAEVILVTVGANGQKRYSTFRG